MTKRIHVVGAVIVSQGKVLAARRASGATLAGLWEFPGGKIESGENAREALAREIREELDCDVNIGDELVTTVHEYSFAIVELTTFWCTLVSGAPTLSDHDEIRWLSPTDMHSVEWAPADVPAVSEIVRNGIRSGAQRD